MPLPFTSILSSPPAVGDLLGSIPGAGPSSATSSSPIRVEGIRTSGGSNDLLIVVIAVAAFLLLRK